MFDQQILEQIAESNQVRENNREEAARKEAIRKAGIEAIERARNSA
jgi:hypothetical protein